MQLARLWRNMRRIAAHPLVKTRTVAAFKRYAVFHLVHRLLPGPALYPFVEGLHYLGQPGEGLIAGNIYTGLYDFREMTFLVHFLREDDIFLDVGANVGVYTLLAAGLCGARTIAVEPIPSTYHDLLINLRLNDLHTVVRAERVGLGATQATVRFVEAAHSAWSHVAASGEGEAAGVDVAVLAMDDLVGEERPCFIKIDVEGYEYEVLKGATATLADAVVRVVLVEMNGSGRKYGMEDEEVHDLLAAQGFVPHVYDPFARQIAVLNDFAQHTQNVLYLRDTEFVQQRVAQGRPLQVHGRTI